MPHQSCPATTTSLCTDHSRISIPDCFLTSRMRFARWSRSSTLLTSLMPQTLRMVSAERYKVASRTYGKPNRTGKVLDKRSSLSFGRSCLNTVHTGCSNFDGLLLHINRDAIQKRFQRVLPIKRSVSYLATRTPQPQANGRY